MTTNLTRYDLVTCPAHPEWGTGIVLYGLGPNRKGGPEVYLVSYEHDDIYETTADEVVPVSPDPLDAPAIIPSNPRGPLVQPDPPVSCSLCGGTGVRDDGVSTLTCRCRLTASPPDPQSEPVAWLIPTEHSTTGYGLSHYPAEGARPLYTQAPALPDDRRIAREAIALLAKVGLRDGVPKILFHSVEEFLARPDVQALRLTPRSDDYEDNGFDASGAPQAIREGQGQ